MVSKNFWMSTSSTQSYFQHLSRHAVSEFIQVPAQVPFETLDAFPSYSSYPAFRSYSVPGEFHLLQANRVRFLLFGSALAYQAL